MDHGAQARLVAARVIDAVLHHGRSLKAELAAALAGIGDVRDRALVEAMAFAAIRHHGRYAAALSRWMPRPPGARDAPLRALLYAGFAQLDPMGLPAHAALNATVDAARLLGRAHQANLVNALLRRAQKDGLPSGSAEAAWPAWLLAEVRADWPRDADAILTASAAAAPQWLRVNARRGTRDAYYTRLVQAGLQAEVPDAMPEALRLAAPVPVDALPGFADGDVSIQDGAAQRVADALRPASGARVLDACAAPGGKSAHLLERDPARRLLAIDIAAPRVARIEQTFARLGIGAQARVRTADALDLARWWDGAPFDAVLLDAPCSATGIVRRQPDVLLHRRPKDLDALVALQAQLLDALATVLAPGGVLLYATCSILRRENAAQVEAFLARHPAFALEPLDARFGRDTGAGHQRLPGEDGMDGFFYARLVRAR
ncbi:16S rRNA (cytosine(967)-C(5))-methyltransferase RsmB [Luteimonas sp BLCC-B24]|uniref:16S rRNA (cytosine(967)-C(5))-methyltransferase RsmB n=1 Tax=Luteimonas sp. BLCC-B24 TaxID=3025317 RepID=UPI00234D0919|nr:16S rRNA (cytosine(967)-C(5))-methyltransferase RsmB [Luteimonas sp. BLCC-B24]MDC7806083.1 16S rRNA (cytosine(967)-C(5))-methyltransferase RsmB [Luteimonas sp. BLCC-B24]